MMELRARLNKRGFTLIEMLIAMVIILVAMLGLFKVTVLSIDSNLTSALRDEGVKVAQQVVNELRSLPYDQLNPEKSVGQWWSDTEFNDALGYSPLTINRQFRNLPPKNYYVVATVYFYSPGVSEPDMKEINVVVGWDHKGENPPSGPTNREFQHSISTIVRNPL